MKSMGSGLILARARKNQGTSEMGRGANRPAGRRESWIPHFVLIMGVVVFAFPIYFALIGSTHDAATISTGRMPLLPGAHLIDNYWQALSSGSGERVSSTPVRTLMFNSLVMALVIAVGKI